MDITRKMQTRLDILVWLTLIYSYIPTGSLATEVPNEMVTSYRGESVMLTCPIDVTSCGALHSVKWFKGNDRVAVVSGDGAVKTVEGPFTGRMTITHNPKGPASTLNIKSVQVFDEDSYVCETTFLEPMENCENTGSFSIGLQVYVHPASINVLDEMAKPIVNATILGPFHEGSRWSSTCEVRGTRPNPHVGWYRAGKRLTDSVTIDEADGLFTVKSVLSLNLSRHELGAFIECRVESAALADVIRSQFFFDMHVRPTKVQLSGIPPQMAQGIIVQAVCIATGARPAVNITWFNNTHTIEALPTSDQHHILTKSEIRNDGTFTTLSKLVFTASPFENGATIWCEASTYVPQNNVSISMKDSFTMEVMYPPIVTINPANITVNETAEFQLDCKYLANPKTLKSIKWLRNSTVVDLNQGRVHATNFDKTSILVKEANRNDIGVYHCELENLQGIGKSLSEINVDVHFVPVVDLSMEPNSTIIENNESNVTLFCNVLSGNPSTLLKVRWFLDGQILKELPECAENELEENEPLCGVNPNVLLLENVGREFLGNYSCEGMNMAGWGRRSKETELTVYFEPGNATLSHSPMVATKKKNVTFTCTVDDLGYPKATRYRWLRGGSPVMDVLSSVWTVDPVGLDSRTSFSCFAFNEGGKGQLATVNLDVKAPQTFIQKLHPYTGALFSAPAISLTCRVECVPICEITWFKNGVGIDVGNDHYTIKNTYLPAEPEVGDFESVRSVLHFNMSAWPDKKFDIMRDNANYSCASSSVADGPGVRSATYFGVEYPPNNTSISTAIVHVEMGSQPPRVSCSAKAYPEPSYEWRRNNQVVVKGNILYIFRNITIEDGGAYECVAFNKHGQQSVALHMNVLHRPNCTLIRKEIVSEDMLVCTAVGNPSEINFEWTMRSENQSIAFPEVRKSQVGNISTSFMLLDDDLTVQRVYRCMANNSLGAGQLCEIEVSVWPKRHILWWQRLDKISLYVMLGIVISLLLAVIIVCIIILCICRKRRRQNKYHTDLSISATQSDILVPMQQNENEKFSPIPMTAVGSSSMPDIPKSPPKWPLRPGVMVHVKVDTKQNLCAARAQSPLALRHPTNDASNMSNSFESARTVSAQPELHFNITEANSDRENTNRSLKKTPARKHDIQLLQDKQMNRFMSNPKPLSSALNHFEDTTIGRLNSSVNEIHTTNEYFVSDKDVGESIISVPKKLVDSSDFVPLTRKRVLERIFGRLPKRMCNQKQTNPNRKLAWFYCMADNTAKGSKRRRSVNIFGSGKSSNSGKALFDKTDHNAVNNSNSDVIKMKSAHVETIRQVVVADDVLVDSFDTATKSTPPTTASSTPYLGASNNDNSLVGVNQLTEPGEYNILSIHSTGARPKKLPLNLAQSDKHDLVQIVAPTESTPTTYSYNLANSFPPCYSTYRSSLNHIDNANLAPSNCQKNTKSDKNSTQDGNTNSVSNKNAAPKKPCKPAVVSESSPKFHSLRTNKSCKHHISFGNLTNESDNTTMPYISQQFQNLDVHPPPYYENITDSIQIHEASMCTNDELNHSIVHNDEYYVVKNENDQLHRNSLYRSDSGISNSSYDCTTPVPAPRPNSRKCQSVPVYMNLPGKNNHHKRCINGSGRLNKGQTDNLQMRNYKSILNDAEAHQTCDVQSLRKRKPSNQRSHFAETTINKQKFYSTKNRHKPKSSHCGSSDHYDASSSSLSSASAMPNQLSLSLLPSARRPVKLPLRKHHTFHFQSSQTVAGARNYVQNQLASSTHKKHYRNQGPLVFKPFTEENAFKPITPVPMSPSQPLTKTHFDDLSWMPTNHHQHNSDHFGLADSCYSGVPSGGGVSLRRHTSNVEDYSGHANNIDEEERSLPNSMARTSNPVIRKLHYANLETLGQRQTHKHAISNISPDRCSRNIDTITTDCDFGNSSAHESSTGTLHLTQNGHTKRPSAVYIEHSEKHDNGVTQYATLKYN